ncbi:hypothetical protein [Streptomyces sp. MZ04]|uniref:hypothetical protein n=1 Tax=Streptomyces sp. MZ04 TaxID=2559236 RepID=UPI00107E96EC|nr:hypothetical protein [Streptomyces sp. MZ04]TGA85870.1 hypothetical protein E2651_41550 [Streptomyces sp. MZ04]
MRRTSLRPARPLSSVSLSPSPLEAVESAFLALASGSSPLTLSMTPTADSDATAPQSIARIRARMVHPSCTEQARARVWQEVLRRRALCGEPWGTVAVGLAIPALRRTLARLPRLAEVEACEVEQEVLTAVTAELAALAPHEPHTGLRLVRAGDRAAHRLLYAAQRARRTVLVPLDENTAGASPLPARGTAEVFAVLERAVDAGVLVREEAELIAQTRLERAVMAQAASVAGMSVRTAFRRRADAEQRLALALTAGEF